LIKRLCDIGFILVSLPILLPLCLAVGLLVYFMSGSPILFRQVRPGKHLNSFEMLKFRTMTEECDVDGQLLPDSLRLTKFGRFLRSSSLDELPELWNVIKGDMSLVGPRPLLIEYIPLYSKEQAKRHDVRPGITGWAQVNGRNSLSWEEKFKLDVWYINNQSFFLDIKIIWLTALTILKRRHVEHTLPEKLARFKGRNK